MNLLEIADFWSNVDIGADDDCWPWKGRTAGYGSHRFRSEKRPISSHRAAYMIVKGTIRAGNLVRHTCDNPPCCNPAHLFQGTEKDTARACVARGRSRTGVAKRLDAARPRPAPQSLNQRAAIAALRHGLLPIAIIAERAGISRATANRWAKKKIMDGKKSTAATYDDLWKQALDEAKKDTK